MTRRQSRFNSGPWIQSAMMKVGLLLLLDHDGATDQSDPRASYKGAAPGGDQAPGGGARVAEVEA